VSLQARYKKEPQPNPAPPPKPEKPRKRLSSAQMAKEADLQMRANARAMFETFWKAVDSGLKSGDAKAMSLFAQMVGYTKNSPMVAFNQQINQGATQADSRVRRFDGIVSMLEDRDEARKVLTAAPAEISDEDAEDILDPEFDPEVEEEEILDAETESVP
jgi:hypothetical protein